MRVRVSCAGVRGGVLSVPVVVDGQVFVIVSQEDPRYNPNGSAANGKRPFNKPAKSVNHYPGPCSTSTRCSTGIGFGMIWQKQ